MSLPAVRGPLVLTVALDEALASRLNSLRKRFFPPHRNHLDAHITLFHAIPPQRLQELDGYLRQMTAEGAPFDVFVGEPRRMGYKGVMLMIRERPSGGIEKIHDRLRQTLKRHAQNEEDNLTNQDLHSIRKAHVVVLNKAESQEEVDACFEEMTKVYDGHQDRGRALGLDLWEYQGGPWKYLKRYEFSQSAPS